MEIATMCLRGLGAGHWAGLRRNGVAEPVMRGFVKNIEGMRMPDEPFFSPCSSMSISVHPCLTSFLLQLNGPVPFPAPGPEARRNDWFKTSGPYSNIRYLNINPCIGISIGYNGINTMPDPFVPALVQHRALRWLTGT